MLVTVVGHRHVLELPGPAIYASSTLDSSPPTKIENYQRRLKKKESLNIKATFTWSSQTWDVIIWFRSSYNRHQTTLLTSWNTPYSPFFLLYSSISFLRYTRPLEVLTTSFSSSRARIRDSSSKGQPLMKH